jgi:hypothetical protein
VLRRIFAPKRDEVTGGWRKLHIGYWWESQKQRDHWEDQDVGGWTIKMDLTNMGWCGLDMAQDRDQWRDLVNTVLNFRVV